jgi:hypothetical protein
MQAAQRRHPGARGFAIHSRMREYILSRPAGEIKARPIGQKPKTGGGQRLAAFTRQQQVEPLLEP